MTPCQSTVAIRGHAPQPAVREAAPGLEVHVEGEAVVLSGRDLTRRFVEDAALRWLAWEARYER